MFNIPFQFEISIRKAAEQLVSPKTLPEPRLHPHRPFTDLKLRHVDQAFTEMKPQPENPELPAPVPSLHSGICFMRRILHRLREVEEHVSEVKSISASSVCFLLCLLFASLLHALILTNTSEWLLIIYYTLIIRLDLCTVKQNVKLFSFMEPNMKGTSNIWAWK